MRRGAAPPIRLRPIDQTCTHRVHLHVARGRQQIIVVQDERRKPSRPRMPPPTLAEAHAPRVPPVRFADAQPKAILGTRHGNQMNVVRHQAVRPDLDAATPAPLGHQVDASLVVLVAEGGLLPTVSSLGNVMQDPGHYRTCYSWHDEVLDQTRGQIKASVWCPQFPIRLIPLKKSVWCPPVPDSPDSVPDSPHDAGGKPSLTVLPMS